VVEEPRSERDFRWLRSERSERLETQQAWQSLTPTPFCRVASRSGSLAQSSEAVLEGIAGL
jgi:hypothetical protein